MPAILLLLAALPSVSAPRQNIVLFVADDHGLDAGCYGNPIINTPNLDRLASEGTRFTYAYCTTASCSASHSVLLTGLHNHLNGQYGHQHDYHNFHTKLSVRSLPVLLAEAGYRTAHVGKFHVQPESVYHLRLISKETREANAARSQWPRSCQRSTPLFPVFLHGDPHGGGGTAKNKLHQPNYFGNQQNYEGIREVTYDPKQVIVPPFPPDTPETRAELAEYYSGDPKIAFGTEVSLGTRIIGLRTDARMNAQHLPYTERFVEERKSELFCPKCS